MTALVFVEHDNKTLKPATLCAVTAAQQCAPAVELVVLGHQCSAVVDAAKQIAGVSVVHVVDDAALANQLAEAATPMLVQLMQDKTHLLAAATTTGKNILPRVAALLDVQMVSEAMRVDAPNIFLRPIYAGNALALVESAERQNVLTIRTTNFAPAAAVGGAATVQNHALGAANTLSAFVGQELSTSARPELTAAKIVVSGGRGVGSAENFKLIEQVADAFGAAMGASRAAVDAGFVPNDYQVGQTGKVVAPELYVAIGISGAIQHLAGMKDSKYIAAINKDGDAPIFQVADYGLVADLFAAVPELVAALKK